MSTLMPNSDHFSYERLVGIRHHVTAELPGIQGEIKNMLSDFIVQEITMDKDVIKTADGAFVDPRQQRKPSRNSRKYTRFVLKKFGFDTIHAIEFIARRLGVRPTSSRSPASRTTRPFQPSRSRSRAITGTPSPRCARTTRASRFRASITSPSRSRRATCGVTSSSSGSATSTCPSTRSRTGRPGS